MTAYAPALIIGIVAGLRTFTEPAAIIGDVAAIAIAAAVVSA
ncbi:MAG TPA: hypothetical protein VGG57_15485 [Stellaceae bacterium]